MRFDLDSSELSFLAAANVDKIAFALAEVLPEYAAGSAAIAHIETVFVEGHTDVRGADGRNWQLSTERAVNTYRRLAASQPDLLALQNGAGNSVLSVSGYGATRPVPDTAVEDYDRQRRIDLRFVMDIDNRERLDGVLRLIETMSGRLEDLQRAVEQANVR